MGAVPVEALRAALGQGALGALLCDHGAATPLRPIWGLVQGPPFAGPARTVVVPPGGLDAVRGAAASLEAGDVLVVAADGLEAAVWGENLARLARDRRVAGVVIDGYVRDLALLRRLDAPVRARGTFPGRAQAGGTGRAGVVVQVAGTRVAPGDIVVADADGVGIVRAADLARVGRELDAWLAAEAGG